MTDEVIDKIIEYENGNMSEKEIIEFFQLIYNTGDWEKLGENYKNAMTFLISTGKIQKNDN